MRLLTAKNTTATKTALLVAVVFAPLTMLNTALAAKQDDGAQARLFLQVQQMRQEIGELRDKLDHQAFELKKLKQAQQAAAQQAANQYVPQYQREQPNALPLVDSANSTVQVTPNVVANSETASSNQYAPVEERQILSRNGFDNHSANANQAAPVITPDVQATGSSSHVIAVPSSPPPNVSSNVSTNVLPNASPNVSTSVLPNATALNNPTAEPSSVISEVEYYQQGFELLKQSQNAKAVAIFKQQISTYPSGEYADDAYYWIGESMFVKRDLDQAKVNFGTIIQSYKQSPRVPDAMLKMAYIEQQQGNNIEARIVLQEILQYHPNSNAAIVAKTRLAKLN